MGPSGRTRRGTRTRTARKTRSKKSELKRSTSTSTATSPILKSNNKHQSEEEEVLNSPSRSSSNDDDFPKTEGIEFEAVDDVSTSTNSTGCSTPKGRRFRIPEIRTCPPAPKKQRVISNCSIQRTPIAFFAPPDLELFFYLALRGISV
ncbi:hypothetical protein TIFTF001_001262 [Ficus carica]|uniref:Uncharacterized protein n=1 Tax=Ficus carica TaxID=3494 RepID=A0AA87Z6D0_FICCA|nr:hypothetical protein TIFTF001_001262 [Ficus carica]